MKSDPNAAAMREIADLPQEFDATARIATLRKHLAAKSNWVVSKAAKMAAELRVEETILDLAGAFRRFIPNAAKSDKGCVALSEIVAALYALDCSDADVYLAGIHHRQMEGSYGPPVDAAAQLRAHSAMGLARTHHPEAAIKIVALLADTEPVSRGGAARALAMLPSEAGALLLRYKVLAGDRDPNVIAECFAGLLACDAERSVCFVAEYLDSESEEIAEAAALALGDSRLPAAVEALMEKWRGFVHGDFRRTLLLALATARQDAAVEFLLSLIEKETPQVAASVIAAMRIYRSDLRVRGAMEGIVERRGEIALVKALREIS